MTIEIIPTIAALRVRLDDARTKGARVGLVPTMGYLHAGHTSLMAAARAENDLAVTSIFVNPLQFAAGEDLTDYPRDLTRDIALASDAGVDVVFTPSVDEMYPFGAVLTTVTVDQISTLWEGATRPTHFAGVATVVAKLFAITGPCRAYFGEKDFQQLAVVRRMAADLSLPVSVVGCPIVREADGLALSSRNVYLGRDERAAATVLRRALDDGLAAIESGQRCAAEVIAAMTARVATEPLAQLDYCAAVDANSFLQPEWLSDEIRLLIACRVGRPRLIDNAGVMIIE